MGKITVSHFYNSIKDVLPEYYKEKEMSSDRKKFAGMNNLKLKCDIKFQDKKGKTREIFGKRFGISGRTFDKMLLIIDTINNEKDLNIINKIMSLSIHRAYSHILNKLRYGDDYDFSNKIYIFQSIEGNGNIKLGISNNVKERLRIAQYASPVKLKIVNTINNCYFPDETSLHKKYKKYRDHGEWFKEDILEEVDLLFNTKKNETQNSKRRKEEEPSSFLE